MYETQYGPGESTQNIEQIKQSGYDSIDAREENSTINLERTEELPEQKDDGEIKKTFRERGGVPYVHNASFLGSQEFAVMPTEGGRILSLKNQDTKVGLYSVDEDGNNKTVIEEDGTMPRVEEIYQILVQFMEETNDAISKINDRLDDLDEDIEDIEERLDDLENPTP